MLLKIFGTRSFSIVRKSPLCPNLLLPIVAVIAVAQLGLLLPVAATAAKVRTVIGKDDRRLVPAKYSELAHGIGLLVDRVYDRRCTAFCIAPNIIATNAHCLNYRFWKGRKRDRDVRDFSFYLYREGRVVHTETLKFNKVGTVVGNPRLSILAGDPPRGGKRTWIKSVNRDWAIARIWRPTCHGDVLKFADRNLLTKSRSLTKSKVFLIGFHGDTLKKDRLHRYSPCRITRVRGKGLRRSIEHTCDSVKGASGSPIFMDTAQGPRVVALHAGNRWRSRWKKIRGKKVTTWFWKRNLGLLPLEFLPKITRYEKINFITNDIAISELQNLLKTAGFYKGRVDDKFGPATKAAIIKFEVSNELTPLGIPTDGMLRKLGYTAQPVPKRVYSKKKPKRRRAGRHPESISSAVAKPADTLRTNRDQNHQEEVGGK